MTEQYPLDPNQTGAAEAAFDYLKRKDEDDDTMVFQGSDYFGPLPPMQDGEITHYAFPIQYEPDDNGLALERIVMADMKGNIPIGFGQAAVIRNREGNIIHDPEVVHTETVEGQRQKGYGRNRLIALNKFVGEYFGRPLQSNVNMEPEAELTWRSLVRDGLAEELSGRFKFRNAPTTSKD